MGKLGWGAAVVGTTACLSVAVSGLAGSTGPIGSFLPPIPRAAADELPAFDDCEELLGWYVEKALPLVGPYGFGYPYFYDAFPTALVRELSMGVDGRAMLAPAAMPSNGRMSTDAGFAEEAVGNSETGTNVQEVGVDEPDVAKTDGDVIYRLRDNHLVITEVSGKNPIELSRSRLPRSVSGEGLLLVGDTVVVTGHTYGNHWGGNGSRIGYFAAAGVAQVAAYDVGDPESPALRSVQEFEGTLVEARQYGETMRLVVQTGTPELDFVQPGRRRTEREATRDNKDIVRNSTIEDWLPTVEVDGRRKPLVECEDVRHPLTDSGFGTLSIITFDASTPLDRETVAVTTSGSLAYSSTDRLYVATPVQPDAVPLGWFGDVRRRIAPDNGPARTEVHAFELDGTATTYVASGSVEGQVRDRWSFDENGGDLRIATAHTRNWETVDNGVTVLREQNGSLRQVGSVRGLGRGEEIKSVRWFDDLAVVVTFRQVDPLYTIDLSDPTNPKVLGELKIPGFSSYLHPIGGDLLLGVGTAATLDGRTQGAQVATFDLSDLRDPRRLSVLTYRNTDLSAAWDPHAFTFVGDTAWTLANMWSPGTPYKMLEIEVGPHGELTEVASHAATHDTRTLPISGDRVALVGNEIRLVG